MQMRSSPLGFYFPDCFTFVRQSVFLQRKECVEMHKENLHEDHRKRMRKRISAEGIDARYAHEILEVLLYSAIPRVDTNPIAHRLLNRFGTLGGVLSASVQELCTVEGVGEKTAEFLKLINTTRHFCAVEEQPTAERYDTVHKIGRFLIPLFEGLSQERMYLLMFDNMMSMIACEIIQEGRVDSVTPEYRKIGDQLAYYGASVFVLAHNHPGGIAIPSSADISYTENAEHYFRMMDYQLAEHFVVSGQHYAPIMIDKRLYHRMGEQQIFWEESHSI